MAATYALLARELPELARVWPMLRPSPFSQLAMATSQPEPELKTAELKCGSHRAQPELARVQAEVWMVLLAAALKGKSDVTELHVTNYMLILGGSTIITGICPLLACCIFKNQRVISDAAALISAAILFSLACWVALFTVWDVIVVCVAGVSLCVTVLRMIVYWVETKANGHPDRPPEFHTILDGSHEFLCCMTGIHFLWLGSLAVEGLTSKSHGIQNDLSEAMGIVNIIICAIGLCTMHIEMTPPLTSTEMSDIAGPLFWFDTFMFFSIGTVLGASMWKSLVLPGLLLLIVGPLVIVGPLIAVFVLVLDVSCPEQAGVSQDKEPPKLAPLGLTKLMVTGFITVSISVDSTNVSITNWFLVFSAAAILSGITWRLLTQAQVRNVLGNNKLSPPPQATIDNTAAVAYSAKTACFCAHTFVVIATVLLMFEICNGKQSTSAAAPAYAPALA